MLQAGRKVPLSLGCRAKLLMLTVFTCFKTELQGWEIMTSQFAIC